MPLVKLNFLCLGQLASPFAFVLVEIDPLDDFLSEENQRIFRVVFAGFLEMFHGHDRLEEMEVGEGEVPGWSCLELGIESNGAEVVACLEGQHACIVQYLLLVRTIFELH